MEYRTQSNSKRLPLHIRVMYIVAVALTVLVIVLLNIKPAEAAQQTEAVETPAPTEGELAQADEEIQFADLKASGAFAYAMKPVVTLRDGQLDFEIENLSTGQYALQVEITISGGDYDGQEVYKTGFIAPSYGVETAKILKELPEGLYGALAKLHAIDMNTEQSIGFDTAAIVVSVPGAAPTPSPTPTLAPSSTPEIPLTSEIPLISEIPLTPDPQDTDTADTEEIVTAENETTPTQSEADELSVPQLEEILGITSQPAGSES